MKNEIDQQIIEFTAEGKTAKEISWLLNIKSYKITYRLKALMKLHSCKSKAQLIAKLFAKNSN